MGSISPHGWLNAEEPSQPLPIIFFYHPGCPHCVDALRAVRAAETHFADAIRITRINTSRGDGSSRMLALLDDYGYDQLRVEPLNLFTPRQHLAGGQAIIEHWQSAIENELKQPNELGPPIRPVSTAGPERQQTRLGWLAISAAALADAINPCAFATIVMLISLLAASGRQRNEVLAAGMGFAAGVFVAYLAIGLVLYGILQQLRHLYVISDLVTWLAFAICLLGMVVCLYDALLAWRGRRAGEMLLKVPRRLRHRITGLLRHGLSARMVIIGAFAAGLVVSLIESLCTGAVYFPVIAGLIHTGNAEALFKLLWYNTLFVLPIVIIVSCVWAGMGSEKLIRWGNSSWGMSKLLLAAVFALMALWLWQTLVWPPGQRDGNANAVDVPSLHSSQTMEPVKLDRTQITPSTCPSALAAHKNYCSSHG